MLKKTKVVTLEFTKQFINSFLVKKIPNRKIRAVTVLVIIRFGAHGLFSRDFTGGFLRRLP